MAKKGGVQQLQTEITTDEELAKFLEKDGLLVMDVYSEWCGPCVAMVGSLKKIKMEKGGDDLQLAIVKSDNVTAFKRFQNKSEPTWLFASHGKLVNGIFGTNVPKLMALICDELEKEQKYKAGEIKRHFIELTDMIPLEQERYNIQLAIQQEQEQRKIKEIAEKRQAYISSVTDEISSHAADFGVTLCMPHVNTKDIFKRLTEHSQKLGLTAKDKRSIQMQPADLEVLHFEIDNPIPKYMLHLLYEKEAFFVCWKNAETELRPIEEILTHFVDLLSTPQPIQDVEADPDIRLPPVLKPMSLELTPEQYAELFDEDIEVDSTNIASEETYLTAIDEMTSSFGGTSKSSTQVIKINKGSEENKLKNKDSRVKEGPETKSKETIKSKESQKTITNAVPSKNSKDKIKSKESQKTVTYTEQLPTNSKETIKSKESQKTLTNAVMPPKNSKDKIKSKESQKVPTTASKETERTTTEVADTKENKELIESSETIPLVGGKSSEESRGSVLTVIENVALDNESSIKGEDAEENNSVKDDEAYNWKEEEKVKVIAPGNRVVSVPPIWTPANKRASAAFIFLYFRTLTDHFLDPDPVPDPPHVAMCFDAIKRKELMGYFDTVSKDILAYGYFSSEIPQKAKLIARSTLKYEKKVPTMNDKLVIKVAKVTSHTMLALSSGGPCYISQNTDIGFDECQIFFPEGYRNSSEVEKTKNAPPGEEDDDDSSDSDDDDEKNDINKEHENKDDNDENIGHTENESVPQEIASN